MIGIIEFTSGVLRDGIMKWYKLFNKDTGLGVPQITDNWGLWAAVMGIIGAFLAGWASDRFFVRVGLQWRVSRRLSCSFVRYV